jgi:hypothetical protein
LTECEYETGTCLFKTSGLELYITAPANQEGAGLYLGNRVGGDMQSFVIEGFKNPETLMNDDDRCLEASRTTVFYCGNDVFQNQFTAVQTCKRQGMTATGTPWVPAVRPGECSKTRYDEQYAAESNLRQIIKRSYDVKLELEHMRKDIVLYRKQYETNCMAFFDLAKALQGVWDVLKNIMCQIIEVGIGIVAWVLDKLLGMILSAAGCPLVTTMQTNPMCNGIVGMVKGGGLGNLTKVGWTLKGASTAVGQTLSMLSEKPGVGDQLKTAATKDESLKQMNWGAKELVSFPFMLQQFALNLACGKFISAIVGLLMPLIMCNLPLKADGSMCQTQGCYR